LCYIFGGLKKNFLKELKYFAKERNLEIRYVPIISEEYASEIKLGYSGVYGPREFVELFMNSEYIVTNTFHGLAFSIIFEKKFTILPKNKKNSTHQERLNNIMKICGLENRYYDYRMSLKNAFNEVDYLDVNRKLDIYIEKSISYLKNSITIVDSEKYLSKIDDNLININDIEKKNCTGCLACVQVCKQKCITEKIDKEGFVYPYIIGNECIKCGKCVKICPANIFNKKVKPVKSLLGYSKNDKITLDSASGGVFITIANYVITELQGCVFGVILENKTLKCKHVMAENLDELYPMQNSKYIQSYIGDCYIQCKKKLENNQFVLFSGTPCQIAGLQNFLDKVYSNLITIDIICHGVPSPEFWRKYIHEIKSKRNRDISKYTFRNKRRGTQKSVFESTIKVNDKERYIYSMRDTYYAPFVRCDSYRYSCYHCQYASLERISDITIGDCDSRREYKDYNPDKTMSTILINTEKGFNWWKKVEKLFNYTNLDLVKESIINTPLYYPSLMTANRNLIYNDLDNFTWKKFKKKYTKSNNFLHIVKKIVAKLASKV
jgi:coenzyme F420-reducing hydrogenase beta subunit